MLESPAIIISLSSNPHSASTGTDNSETQAQREALVEQIQAVMTADQLKAIAEMKMTRETAMTIMQEQGMTLGGRANRGGDDGQGLPLNGQLPGNGQRPAGPARGGMVPPELIEALIQALEKTSGEQSGGTVTPAS